MKSVTDHERAQEEREFMRAVVAGLADLDAGREVDFDEARELLGSEIPPSRRKGADGAPFF